MRWLKADLAAEEWCGGVSAKTLYLAVKNGRLKAARIGAGRNLLFCESWCDQWLLESAKASAPTAETRAWRTDRGDGSHA